MAACFRAPSLLTEHCKFQSLWYTIANGSNAIFLPSSSIRYPLVKLKEVSFTVIKQLSMGNLVFLDVFALLFRIIRYDFQHIKLLNIRHQVT